MQATQIPENLCPIIGLAGLFGPDRFTFFRRRTRRGTRESDKDEGPRDRAPSRAGAEEAPGEPSPRVYARDEDGTNVSEPIERLPEPFVWFDDPVFGDGGSTDHPVASDPSEVIIPGHSLLDGLSDGVTEEPDELAEPLAEDQSAPQPGSLTDEEPTRSFELQGEGPSPLVIKNSASLPEDESGPPDESAIAVDDRPVELLIDDLGSDDAGVRERAVYAIARRGSGAVAPLIEALSLADDRKRWCVAEALAAIGEEAIPALIAALGDDAVQAGAAATLVRIGGSAVPPLIAVLADDDDEVQFGARYVLQEIGDESIPFLVAALDRPDRNTRRTAAEVLGNIGWNPPDDASAIQYLIAAEAWLDVAEYGSAAIEPLIHILRSPDGETRWNAARTLGEIGETAVVPLIDLLHEADGEISSLAAMALAEIGSPAVNPLIRLLSDPSIRGNAAGALVRMGRPAAERCVQALDRADRDTQETLREVLTAIGEPAIPPLIQALTADRSGIRTHAAEILDGMGWEPWSATERAWYLIAREQWIELAPMGRAAVGPLIRALNSDDDRIRSEAAGTLGEIGDAAAVGPLVDALADENVAPAAADALVAIGKAAIAPVLRLLEEETGAAQENAVEVLGRLGAQEATPAIVDLVRRGGDRLHRKAVDALIGIGAPAIGPLISLLGEDGDGHAGAVAALTRIGDDAREPLVEALVSDDARIRVGAAMVLERLGWVPAGVEEQAAYLVALQRWPDVVDLGVPAAGILAARLGDMDANVQAGAAEALVRIGPPAVPSLIRLLGEEDLRGPAGDILVQMGEAAVEHLVSALDEEGLCQAAAGVLERLGRPAAIALIPVLGRDDSREVVAEVLAAMGEASIEPLVGALGSDDARIRQRAGDLLISLGDIATDSLIVALGRPDDALRLGVIETLTRTGRPAIPALTEALLDEDYRIRLGAAEVLGRIGWLPETEEETVSYLIAKEQWASVAELGPGAVRPLIRALDDPDTAIQMGAARALGLIGEPAVAELISALRDERDSGQRKAVEALKLVGEPAVGPLIDALQDHDWHIRLGASRALVAIGEPAVEPLIRALRSGPPAVQMGVAATLGKIGNRAAIEPLTDTLLQEDWRVGRVVVRALGMLGEPAVKPLLRVIREGGDVARKGAVAALVLIGEPAARLLPDALTDWHFRVRAGAADALDRLGWSPEPGEETVHYLIAKEQWSDLLPLGAIAVGPLVQALKDRDDSVRRRAAKILGELRDPRAVLPLMDLLHDDFYSIRREAAAALVTIGAPAIDPIIAVLDDEDDDVRKRAADILAEIGDARAIEALEGIFNDEDWYVQRAAVEAVERIREREERGG